MAMKADSPAQVFHLAAITHVARCESDPEAAHATNVTGTVNVFGSMPSSARGVFASTCHVYGDPRQTPITEDHPLGGQGIYSQTKIAAEDAIRNLGKDVVIARAFHHTGPGQSTDYVLADWASQVRHGADQIRVGDINVERDFSDVRDVVAGYEVLARRGDALASYNLCSGVARPLAYFLECMTTGRNVTVDVESGRLRATDVHRFCGDPGRAVALGWRPLRSIEETLAELAQAG